MIRDWYVLTLLSPVELFVNILFDCSAFCSKITFVDHIITLPNAKLRKNKKKCRSFFPIIMYFESHLLLYLRSNFLLRFQKKNPIASKKLRLAILNELYNKSILVKFCFYEITCALFIVIITISAGFFS